MTHIPRLWIYKFHYAVNAYGFTRHDIDKHIGWVHVFEH